MEKNDQSYLVTEKVGELMGKYAVTCIISLLAGALHNIIDQIFIANAAYLGSYGNTANTVIFPLTVIALAGAGKESAYYTDFAVVSCSRHTDLHYYSRNHWKSV